jgi:hypothetical protein
LYKPTVSDAAAHLLACALAGLLPYLGAASAGGGVIHNDAGVSATDVEGPYGALVARLRRSAVFSPSGGGAALMRLPGLQRPLVQLAQCLPDPQRAVFGLFATAFEEAFNDRFDATVVTANGGGYSDKNDDAAVMDHAEDSDKEGTEQSNGGGGGHSAHLRVARVLAAAAQERACAEVRCSAVVAALRALGHICQETAATITSRARRKFDAAASSTAAAGSAVGSATAAGALVASSEAADEDEGGGEFYLKDLVKQQQRDAEVKWACTNRKLSFLTHAHLETSVVW